MKKKKSTKVFKVILVSTFIVFIGLYIASISGYYDSRIANQTKITAEAINQFEEDVAQGKDVTIEQYLDKKVVDYSNTASKIGDDVSSFLETIMTDGISQVYKVLSKLFS